MSAHWHISSRQCTICEKIIVNIWHIAKHCVSLQSQTRKDDHSLHGEMAEWSNAPVLKTGVLQGTGGSNPSLSATESCKSKDLQDLFFLVCRELRSSYILAQQMKTYLFYILSIISYRSYVMIIPCRYSILTLLDKRK